MCLAPLAPRLSADWADGWKMGWCYVGAVLPYQTAQGERELCERCSAARNCSHPNATWHRVRWRHGLPSPSQFRYSNPVHRPCLQISSSHAARASVRSTELPPEVWTHPTRSRSAIVMQNTQRTESHAVRVHQAGNKL